MSDDPAQTYEQIPIDIRNLLDELYDPEGVKIWWNSHNKLLDGKRARDMAVTPEGRERVAALLDAICDGVFL